MSGKIRTRLQNVALGVTAALFAMAGVSPAHADVHWLVAGVFDDGATLKGDFTINQYGYVSHWAVTTQPGNLAGYVYKPGTSTTANTATQVTFDSPVHKGDLVLSFAHDLSVPAHFDPLVVGGASSECDINHFCPNPSVTRSLVSGSAYVPEPATWTLMALGLGAAGGMARRRKRRPAAIASVF